MLAAKKNDQCNGLMWVIRLKQPLREGLIDKDGTKEIKRTPQ